MRKLIDFDQSFVLNKGNGMTVNRDKTHIFFALYEPNNKEKSQGFLSSY